MTAKRSPFNRTSFAVPHVATDLRIGGSKMVGSNGEINGSSQKDMLLQIAKFLEVASRDGVITADQADNHHVIGAADRRQAILAAFSSREAHAELGEVMAEELYQAANREGFMRRFLGRQELTQGQIPQAKLRMKNVVGITASSPSKTQTQIMRDNLHYPPEFYVTGRPFVEKRDIDRSTADVLEEKYIEALEAIMVAEDRILYKMFMASVGQANNLNTIVGTLSPLSLAAQRNQVTRWDIPAASLLIANDLWNDIVGDAGFQQLIDPVSKHELLLTGQLGNILGMTIYSDAYRHPQHKVLNAGDIFVIGAPVNLGQYTDRGGVESLPIDSAIEGIPGRGWHLQESLSVVVANARAVSVGTRV
jgi:hypothetical protein